MSKTPAVVLQTFRRDQILEAARTVITEHGYDRCSVDQIAKQAGLSRSTVYEYFGSKAEILRGCLASRREELARDLAGRVARARGLEGRLTAFFEVCLSRVDQNRQFFQAITFPLPLDEMTEGPGGGEFARVVEDFNDVVSAILDAGVESGELPQPVSPDDREALGTLIVGAMGARCQQADPPPLAASAARFARFAVRGLGSGRNA
ncbi:MAG: TetR/AcrR family transcriptional regulator [Myxococcota bacterium]